jgi:hypothetical protein
MQKQQCREYKKVIYRRNKETKRKRQGKAKKGKENRGNN